ncbi:hypothetical protein ACS8E9_12005 [Pseudomonas neustonica]|uniref:Uncharacterized protein n=1 Tax=Pseudomonas neustonica TaxID=2487346 RepID=A0ABX9XEY7_9PSED|nr:MULTISPECIES: hypothetical protein [Pseudomonas]MBA6418964.1 hypothetical protein [Pseudomonas sp. 5Ae-yellow]ROZ80997.1 hypothetical protein EF099_15775 [Pseudomonas sp. SSM44]ROZ82327.1 hypothetical protein EF096_15585 [Pseudomonas neustonica]|tara:strand:+ start:6058 stop:6312 length:255 start_codon:yes stop_codon:yes gene_type:complete
MLIPGIPPAGAQHDPVKVKRQVEPTQESKSVDNATSSPVERRQRDNGRWPERRRKRRRQPRLEQAPAEHEFDLPTKGLLVDIEA